MRTGDRVWKMPLFKMYSKQIQAAGHLADINNITESRFAGSCTAAAFLKVKRMFGSAAVLFVEITSGKKEPQIVC